MITVPTSLVINLPDDLKGPPGPPGKDATCIRGTWVPVIGGTGGESGQAYHYQAGTFRRYDGHVEAWGYLQFSALGSIVGNLVLKGIPYPIAMIPHPVGGLVTYFSNPHPDSPQMIALRGNGGQSFYWLDGIPPRGNNPYLLDVNALNPATQLVFHLSYPVD